MTIKQTAVMSRDYTVFRGLDASREHSWFFLNKSGSKWGGEVCIELENFKRGWDPENKERGEVMWRADFTDMPRFEQQLRQPRMPVAAMGFNGKDRSPSRAL